MLASVCYAALELFGLPMLTRRLARGGLVLCYHNVVRSSDAGVPHELGLHQSLPAFERQMRWLAAHYQLVSLDALVDGVVSGKSLRGVAAVTFDDGYAGVFEHAWPLLRALGIPATVFVVADAPDRLEPFWWDSPAVRQAYSAGEREHWLTAFRGDGAAILGSLPAAGGAAGPPPTCRPAGWATIAAAARSGLGIGAHSATHRSLPTLDDRELRHELVESRTTIERRTGVASEFFAYPYGRWNDRVRDAVRAAGYRAAFTLDAGRNAGEADPWGLRRVNVPAGIQDPAFRAWTAGLSLGSRNAA